MKSNPNEIIKRIYDIIGCDVSKAFENKESQNLIKWHAKYVRQNGIYVSPTFMIDGLVASEMSSGDDVNKWLTELRL